MKEKILTHEIVKRKGWNKLDTITADMLNRYIGIGNFAFIDCNKLTSITIPNNITSIRDGAFGGCSGLTSITIPNSVIIIGSNAFDGCSGLTSITIPNSVISIGDEAFCFCGFKFEKRYDNRGRLIAYKGFNADMSCRSFKYEEGKTYEINGEIKLCERGFHACLNSLDCLNYYWGEIGDDVVFHEVYLEEVSDEMHYDSKVVARKITIGREITFTEMADIASGRK